MSEERKVLFSEKVHAGNRRYFFDVKQSKDGSQYLVISESRAVDASFEHHQILIFEENFDTFIAAFDKTITFLGKRQKPKSSKLEELRKEHPKAYTKWSSDEDEVLKVKFSEGMSVAELAQFFQRQPGAIQSRLAKLGLVSPDR